MKIFNEWRRNYAEKTYHDHQAVYSWLAKNYPNQDCSGPLKEMIAELIHWSSQSFNVLELGGWDGRLAKSVLDKCHNIAEWDNYEICPDLQEMTVCHDPRYHLTVLPDFIWGMSLDLTKYDIFVASHVIEHLSVEDFRRLLDEIHHIKVVFLNIPFPENGTWHMTPSLHVLKASEQEITTHFHDKGYWLSYRHKCMDNSIIMRFEK